MTVVKLFMFNVHVQIIHFKSRLLEHTSLHKLASSDIGKGKSCGSF